MRLLLAAFAGRLHFLLWRLIFLRLVYLIIGLRGGNTSTRAGLVDHLCFDWRLLSRGSLSFRVAFKFFLCDRVSHLAKDGRVHYHYLRLE